MEKADACRWNLSKESFMEYAAKKIKILQPLQLEQENIISLLFGGTNNFSVRNTTASINVETVYEFLKRIRQLTNTSMATQKKSPPPSVRKEKLHIKHVIYIGYIKCSKKKSIIFPIDGFSNLYLALYKCDRVTSNGVRKIRFRTKKTS